MSTTKNIETKCDEMNTKEYKEMKLNGLKTKCDEMKIYDKRKHTSVSYQKINTPT